MFGKLSSDRERHVTRAIHKFFWEANFQDKTTLWLCIVLRIPATIAYNTFIPLVGAYAIEAILAHHFERIHTFALWILGLAVVYSICWSTAGIAGARNAAAGCKYVQTKIFSNFLRKDYDFYGNAFFGSLGAQATSIRDAYNGYGELVTLSMPKQLSIILAGIAVIGYQSWELALVTMVCMLLVLSYTLLSSAWRLQFRRKVGQASSVVAGNIGDALSHGATVKSFASEDFEEHRLRQPLGDWAKVQYKSWISSQPADAGRMILAAITTAVLLLLSARLYQSGKISVTIVILIQLYVIRLVTSTLDIAEIIKRYEEIMGMAYQPLATMLVPTTVIDPVRPKRLVRTGSYKLTLSDVSYHYSKDKAARAAVAGFSLTIQPGEKVGLVGYSGSGKTTLSKLLLRFMDVSEGSIAINNVDIRDIIQKDLRKAISYVPQEPLLFHRSIAENIAYGNPRASKTAVQNAMRVAYVDEFVQDLPDGERTLVGERGVKLSGGQRQRVAIARALLKDAPVLVLDEATSALDSRSEKFIQDALWKLMQDRTALVIAHRLSTIQRMDRIVVMDKGKVVQIGTHRALLRDKRGIYARLWAHQSGGYVGVPQPGEVASQTT